MFRDFLLNKDNGIFNEMIHDFGNTKNGFQKKVISGQTVKKFRNSLAKKRN
jgi:hypothetical protein